MVKRLQSSSTSISLAAPPNTSSQPSQSPYPQLAPAHGVKQSPSLPSFTRSASPSNAPNSGTGSGSGGLSNFFSRPTKWFNRSTSSSSRVSPTEPRASTSTSSLSSRRRPTISGPTDPRPIDALVAAANSPGADGETGFGGLDGKLVAGGLSKLGDRASRSVLDLSTTRSSVDLVGAINASPSSTSMGTGDLRSIARRGWSRSVDNLSISSPLKLSPLSISPTSPAISSPSPQYSFSNAAQPTLEQKIEQYRSGTNTPSTPTSINHKILPFPSLPGTPSTPPAGSEFSLAHGGYSGPHNPILRHAHSHSGSNASFPSSSLASPGSQAHHRLAPPSPQNPQAVRKRSFDFDRALTRGKSGTLDSPANVSSNPLGAFSFVFGGSSSSAPGPGGNGMGDRDRKHSNPSTTPMATTPTIIEPSGTRVNERDGEEKGDNAAKRASQVIHRQGFLLRLQNYNASSVSQLSSNKHWKPFKVVLKGSKIYFYKPPSDRAAAVRELFPTGLVSLAEDALEEVKEDVEEEKEKTGSSAVARRGKKRTFWGRRTHPELVHQDGKAISGTFDALVHETLFGTLFKSSPSPAASPATDGPALNVDFLADIEKAREYEAFASSVLLCVPLLVQDRARFESEFIRCAGYYVSGAEETSDAKELAKDRVTWLVRRYLAYHGEPKAAESWKTFCDDVVPQYKQEDQQQPPTPSNAKSSLSIGIRERPNRTSSLGALAGRTGTQQPQQKQNTLSSSPPNFAQTHSLAHLHPSSRQASPSPAHSLRSASGVSITASHATSQHTSARSRLWSALEQGGFTREILLRLDEKLISQSLLAYQRSILEATGAESSSKSNGSVGVDILVSENSRSPLVEIFGSDESPHWLTRLVVTQILGPSSASLKDKSGGGSYYGDDGAVVGERERESSGSSRTHLRSEVIGKWARVGEICRVAGDECSWRAIMEGLCSKPIARLDKAWRRVDSGALGAVKAWVYPVSSSNDGKKMKAVAQEPKRTVWGGMRRVRMCRVLERLRMEEKKASNDTWGTKAMLEGKEIYDGFFGSVSAFIGSGEEVKERDEEEDLCRLVRCWKATSKATVPKNFQEINSFMSMSYAAEPRKKGLFAPYYWSRQATNGPQALVPLLVPDVLPTVTLIDRAQLVRSKKVSYETSNVLGDQTLRASDLRNVHSQNSGQSHGSGENASGGNIGGKKPNRPAFDLGGMMLPVFDGELLLCVVSSPPSDSRPASQAGDMTSKDNARTGSGATTPNGSGTSLTKQPSIRVKPAAAGGLDRKASNRARRASLPALSQKVPAEAILVEQNPDPPLHAVVQAGSLDALVHLLVHGLEGVSVSVADDNGEMSLRDKRTRAVKVDCAEFARIWWPSFRSFVSPYVLFQLLRKDYMSTVSHNRTLPSEEAEQVLRARQAVVRTIAEWIHTGGGAQDALDDPELYAAIHAFLSGPTEQDFTLTPSTESLAESEESHEAVKALARTCDTERKTLLESFTAQTMRPTARQVPVRGVSNVTIMHNFGTRVPNLEEMSAMDLVNNLDAMASAAFRSVNQEDLYITADLLEVQTADRTGWFLPREPSSAVDEVEIQSLYTFLMDVEPSSLAGEYAGDNLYRLLPPGIRSLIRAYNILRQWAVMSLARPGIGLQTRQARMELFLQAIEICRLRSVDLQTMSLDSSLAEWPCVRSFAEAVLVSAIVSPESRAYGRAWQMVANARNAPVESLASLLGTFKSTHVSCKDKLTVDPIWLLERILEILTLSDVLDSPMESETPVNLVNFDKRRQLGNMIINASSYVFRSANQRREMDRCDFERLNRIEAEINEVNFDLRHVKEDALREATNTVLPPPPSRKGGPRPFLKTVLAQQEKIKRDRYMRERLLKEKRHEQQKIERREEEMSKSMEPRQLQTGAPAKHQRGKRSMSALFSLMRPISTAFTSDSMGLGLGGGGNAGPRRTAAELDFDVPGASKATLVMSLVDAQVTAFINNDRSFLFQLDSEDGGHYLLQAPTRNDMKAWIQAISSAVKTYAQRRMTYIGNSSSQAPVMDQIQPRPITAIRDPVAVFGVDLSFLVRREADGEEVSPHAVPKVLDMCLEEIEKRGLEEVGIYRVAGATTEVTALKEALNNGQSYIDQYTDINAVAGVVKYYFRVLPEPVIPEMFFDPIIEAARLPDLDERLNKIREVVHLFPRAHFSVLRRLVQHMDLVVDYEEKNHMTADNLATVICPNLLRAPNNNFGLIMKNMGPITTLFKAFLTHTRSIFQEETEAVDEAEADDIDEEGEVEESVYHEASGELAEVLSVPDMDAPRLTASPEPDERMVLSFGLPSPPINAS